jgi:hypothetical protein
MVIGRPHFLEARAAAAGDQVHPKGLIASYASNKAIKPLGCTRSSAAAVRRQRRHFPLAKSS